MASRARAFREELDAGGSGPVASVTRLPPHEPHQSGARTHPLGARAESGPPRTPAPAGAGLHHGSEGDRAGRGSADAVRPGGLRRPPHPFRGVQTRGTHPGARTPQRGPGMDDALDDPHGVEARLLALHGRDPGAAPPVVAPVVQGFGERRRRRGREDGALPRRRAEAAGRDREGARPRQPDLVRREPLARPRARAAVRNVGAAARRPVRAGVGLARRAARDHRGRRHRASRQALPRRFRPRLTRGRDELHRPHHEARWPRCSNA